MPQAINTHTNTLITVTVEVEIDIARLWKQKRALIGIIEGTPATYEQEEAAEGLLNLLDLIKDSILEQGLASEVDIFPKLPQLFDEEPVELPRAA